MPLMRRVVPVAAALAVAALPAAAEAAPRWTKVAGFSDPVHVAGPAGDASRLFVVERAGRIRLVTGGQTTTFLDLTAQTLADGQERGLLSMAFAPDYVTSGRFYVFLTARGSAWGPGVEDGDVLVARGRRSADGTRGGLTEGPIVVEIDHPGSNHNGGQLAFGPDGALYASVGDGGLDPAKAQDPASLLGKVLRFADPTTDAPPEIWASGLRNPWRFSFDRRNGDLVIGDVGQQSVEEIDYSPFSSAAGRNYGWPACEGSCADGGFTNPAVSLSAGDGFHAVIGGFVVRDPGVPSLLGRYLFADFAKSTEDAATFSVDLARPAVPYRAEAMPPADLPQSLGEDGCGHVYITTPAAVHRLDEQPSDVCVLPFEALPGGGQQQPPPGGGPTPATDTTKPVVRVKPGKRRVRAFVIRVRSAEDARATVKARGYKTRRVHLAAGVPKAVKVTARRATVRKLRDRRRVRRMVRIRVVDAAGNATVKTPRIRLR
jgi:hypothetical protein